MKLLSKHPSPFCMKLLFSFIDADTFYVVMPLAIGGDLAYHLKRKKYFSKKRSRLYAAEITLGLSHMHSLRIIYRDLKVSAVFL